MKGHLLCCFIHCTFFQLLLSVVFVLVWRQIAQGLGMAWLHTALGAGWMFFDAGQTLFLLLLSRILIR